MIEQQGKGKKYMMFSKFRVVEVLPEDVRAYHTIISYRLLRKLSHRVN